MASNKVDLVITNRWNHLKSCADNIVGAKRRPSQNRHDDANDLLGYTAEHFCSNRDRYESMDEKAIESHIVSFMKNQWNWSNASSSKSFKKIHGLSADRHEELQDHLCGTTDTSNTEMSAEDAPDWVKDTITDLHNEGYSNDQIYKVLAAKQAKAKMTPSQRTLFDLYFQDDLSIRDISKLFNIPRSSVFEMIQTIKERVKAEHNR